MTEPSLSGKTQFSQNHVAEASYDLPYPTLSQTASDSLAGPMVQIIFVFLMVIPPLVHLFLSFQSYLYYRGPAAFINRNSELFAGILRSHVIEEKR